MPARDLTTGNNPLSDLCGGAYFYLDKWNRAYVLTTTNEIWQVTITATGLKHTATYSPEIPEGDCMIATMPDWKNRIFFATKGGRIGTVDASTGVSRIRSFPGEAIFNSMAADETGAVYAVTDHRLLTLVADKAGYPQVRWSAAYDRGTRTKPGQLSQGSGTTPTLLGKDVVAITDNAEPRMNVLFYKRERQRQEPADLQGAGVRKRHVRDREQPRHGGEDLGHRGEQLRLRGSAVDHRRKTTSPGVARVDLVDGKCKVAWTSNVSAPTSVPKVSLGNGLLYAYTKKASTRSTTAGTSPPSTSAPAARSGPAHRQRHPVEQPLRVDLPRPGRRGVHAHDGRPGQVQGRLSASGQRTTIQSAAPSSTRNRM